MTQKEQFEARYAKLASGKRQEAGANFRDRAKGALRGLVVGDCLGSPVQFTGKESHPRVREMVKCPVFGLGAGKGGALPQNVWDWWAIVDSNH